MKPRPFFILLVGLFAQRASGQKIENLKVDTTITGFHFAANYQGTYVYTLSGKIDDMPGPKRPSAFSFTMMPNATIEKVKQQVESYINMARAAGYTQMNLVSKDTLINGNTVYWLSYTETLNLTTYKNIQFHGFYIKNGTALLFISGDMDGGRYIELFKKTFFNTTF